jgi:predicted transcriptional regulator
MTLPMATKQKQHTKPPTPREARIAAGLTWRGLAKKAGIGQATISRCERSGEWPRHRGSRLLYLLACGLPTDREVEQ